MDINKKMPNKSVLPDLGINVGNMGQCFLSQDIIQ